MSVARLLMMVLVAVANSLWATAQAAPSETQRVVHESWTFKDGAPELPTALAQTADGYLWVTLPGDCSGLTVCASSSSVLHSAIVSSPPTFPRCSLLMTDYGRVGRDRQEIQEFVTKQMKK